MPAKKTQKLRVEILVLIPVFFLFLFSSMENSHSHVFDFGKIITHSHPIKDCAKQFPAEKQSDSGNQIIVYSALHLDLGDNFQFHFEGNYSDIFLGKIEVPLKHFEDSGNYFRNSGRAPPLVV